MLKYAPDNGRRNHVTSQSYFRPDIQGLRALAVIPVIGFHAFPHLIPGGFLGVDIFFVISGFLITSIIGREIEFSRFSISGFYARRAKRILPALGIVLLFSAAAGLIFLPPNELVALAYSAIATIVFSSNLYFMDHTDYFAQNVDLIPLLHTWSLAVEEQFYIAFPVLLVLLTKLAPRRVTLILSLFAFSSILLSIWLTQSHPKSAFYLPVSRAYELLCGALVARNNSIQIDRKLAHYLSISGLGLIFVGYTLIDNSLPFPGIIAFVPCAGTALVILTGSHHPALGNRLLKAPILGFVGGMSYSLYLWHWPALTFMRFLYLGQQSAGVVLATIAAVGVVSWMSWRFLEVPIARHKAGNLVALTMAVSGMCILLSGFAVIIRAKGFPQRYDSLSLAFFSSAADTNRMRDKCHAGLDNALAYSASCTFGARTAPATAVWADSFGAELSVALGELAGNRDASVMELTASLCPPSLGFKQANRPDCTDHNYRTLRSLIADRRISTVVLAADYLYYPSATREALMAGFEGTAQALHRAGKKVVLVYPIPRQPFPVPTMLGLAHQWSRQIENLGYSPARVVTDNMFFTRRLDALSKRINAFKVLPANRLCDDKRCFAFADGSPLYFDERHLSVSGARYVLRGVSF